MRILLGAVISIPPYSPGMAWNWMQHAVGFRKLGHEVLFVEEVMPEWCFDARGRRCAFAESLNRRLFRETMERFGMLESACQIYNRGEASSGFSLEAVVAWAKEADLLVNMSGHVASDFILSHVQRRVYVDQDPVYTQLWHAEYGRDLNFQAHDVFLSVGLNIGTPRTPMPDCAVEWRHVLPPVVMDHWPCRAVATGGRFTTIASWSGYGDLCYRGEWYRSKYEEFVRFAELPERAGQECEVALKAYREEDPGIQRLRAGGWFLSHAAAIADLARYQEYIAASRGEIGIAKNAYVKGRSGWFSDRAAHYLASGRPVLAQATGFECRLPTGRGLLAFSTVEEAAAGMGRIAAEYAAHCRAAREFAREHLDYRKVLPRMLDLCVAG